jgi:3-oxoacyl-[acyl-carrier-protein] synthase III
MLLLQGIRSFHGCFEWAWQDFIPEISVADTPIRCLLCRHFNGLSQDLLIISLLKLNFSTSLFRDCTRSHRRKSNHYTMRHTIISSTGTYLSPERVKNTAFLNHVFYDGKGAKIEVSSSEIISKFREITGIHERRYIPEGLCTSDIACLSARQALEDFDIESLDYIIVAHNLGDGYRESICDTVPTLAARVKHKLEIRNPYTVAFDIPFGCAGWLQGVITADYFIKSGDAKRILVIGAETPSRFLDPHDRDSMIYSDGAGAAVLEATDRKAGILSHVTRSDTFREAFLLRLDRSCNPRFNGERRFIRMEGHEIYKYALKTVPETVKRSLEKAKLTLKDVSKILIHQANEKMDRAIVKRLFKLIQEPEVPEHIMPMTVSWLGNSWVATLPTLFHLLKRGELENHTLRSGDVAVFASVGAGMNVNAMVYRMP